MVSYKRQKLTSWVRYPCFQYTCNAQLVFGPNELPWMTFYLKCLCAELAKLWRHSDLIYAHRLTMTNCEPDLHKGLVGAAPINALWWLRISHIIIRKRNKNSKDLVVWCMPCVPVVCAMNISSGLLTAVMFPIYITKTWRWFNYVQLAYYNLNSLL